MNRVLLKRRASARATGLTALASWTSGLVMLLAAVAAWAESSRPNVLVIQPDQHRGTIMGCMGDRQARTPNLDRLAKEGILFRNAASSSPVCCPFRATMQTGLYPHKHGVLSNDKYRLDPKHPTFAEMFVKAGYQTGLHRQVASRWRQAAEAGRQRGDRPGGGWFRPTGTPAGIPGMERLREVARVFRGLEIRRAGRKGARDRIRLGAHLAHGHGTGLCQTPYRGG